MAQKTINIGTAELAGDGETLRGAFSKSNDNFTELYAGAGYNNTNVDLHLNTASATSGQILSWSGTHFIWVNDQTSAGNVFSTVASSGQNDIVADGPTDKLYIELK